MPLLMKSRALIARVFFCLSFAFALTLSACGGGEGGGFEDRTYVISGTISGLKNGQQVTLTNNGTTLLTVTSNGEFTFTSPVAFNGSYSITVNSQPNGQICSVANNTGSGAGVTADVSNVRIVCATAPVNTYTIGGSVSGLSSGQQVTLQNNGADALIVTSNGNFTFPTSVAFNGSYSITVNSQPNGQICSVANNTGSGAGVTADVSNVRIVCATAPVNTYTIGGSVSGLSSGQQVTLQNNGADALIVTSNGNFTFPTSVAFNGSYSVTVSTQPVGKTCSVVNNSGSGAGVTDHVSNVLIICANNTYTIGGSVSGLSSGQQVTLQNNGADALTVASNSSFVFSQPVALNGSYSVTVGTQPKGFKWCSVTANPSSVSVTSNVTNVAVSCVESAARASTLVSTPTDNPAPTGVAVDTQGNVYVAQWRDDSGQDSAITPIVSSAFGTISRIDTSNQEITFVPGLTDPAGLTFDASGNLYVIETTSTVIKKVTSAGVVSTFVDIRAIDSNIGTPAGIYFDSQNSEFFVTDLNGRVSVITSAGALVRSISLPGGSAMGVVVDASGNIYVCDYFNSTILKVDTSNNVTTFAGSSQGFADGTTINAKFSGPYGITKDTSGNLYVADQGNNKIRKITAAGVVTTLAPTLSSGAAATFNAPTGITTDANGDLYVTEYYGRKVSKISPISP
jgi:sugar lactone lactonase YvrE